MIAKNELTTLTHYQREADKQLELWGIKLKQAQQAIIYWEERQEAYKKAIAFLSCANPLDKVALNSED